ncbi:MAG: hypothetical protein HKO57_04755, partial [Akkermansiaceae bacterium]|nr:hypothetical protein [Akkermansiaceae bacterium]
SGTLEAYPQGTVQGAFTYDPAGAFTGLTTTTTRTFDYTVTDSLGNVDTTTVTITIDGNTLMRNWRNAFFGPGGENTSGPDNTGDGADSNDFESGGNVNVLEFAFGGDPTIAADDGVALGIIDGTTWTLGNPIMTIDFSPLQVKILYPRVMEADGVTPYADLGYTPQFDFDDGVAGFNFQPDPNRGAAVRVQKDGGGDLPALEAPGLASGVAMKYALYEEIVPMFHPVTGLKLEQLLGRVEVVRGVNAANSSPAGP